MISNCIFTWAITRLKNNYEDKEPVVNWFQIVFLREQSQADFNIDAHNKCCELISNCIFTWAITRLKNNYEDKEPVVNWFQIVFLREQSQADFNIDAHNKCCELISNCIFTWAITSYKQLSTMRMRLWIDFKLYFYVSNHKVNPRLLSKINRLGFLFGI